MRIVAEIGHPLYKMTVFNMNNRLSLKIEDNLLEQIYKFRDGSGVETPEDVQKCITDEFLRSVENIFSQMALARSQSIEELYSQEGEEFPEII